MICFLVIDGEKVADILPRTTSVADGVTLRPIPEDAATRLFADLDSNTRAWALERYTRLSLMQVDVTITERPLANDE